MTRTPAAPEPAPPPPAARVLRPGVGPIRTPFPDVARIAVLRGGGLGDLMFALPALDALAGAYPEAEITLLGSPLHAELLTGRPGPVHRVQVLPFAPGVRPGPEDPAALARFGDAMRARNFDLAVQIHGGGRNSNPFLLRLGAAHTVGTRTPDAVHLERTLPYVYYQQEVLRALEVVGLAGAAPATLEPQLEVLPAEQEKAAAYLLPGTDLVTLHPGATDPRRRWPASSFAAVAVRAAADGCRVLVVGDDGDRRLGQQIVELALAAAGPGADIGSVAGELDIGTLAALLQASAVTVANDSGPRHLAQAVGTPTVGIYWIGNVINAGAMGRTRHRVHMSWLSACPVCGADVTQVDWSAERCGHDDSFVAAVAPAAVYADAALLRAAPPA